MRHDFIKTILFFLTLYASHVTLGQNSVDYSILDHIKTTKTAQHTRIKGTKLYLKIPRDYQHIPELLRYQKREKLYFQIMDTPGPFDEVLKNYTKENIEGMGARIDVHKDIQVNGYKGIYTEGPSKFDGETKLAVFYGDDSFIVMIMCVCKTADIEGKKELIRILTTSYYDKDFPLDPLELANFTFDLSITNFQFAMSSGNMLIYSEDGRKEKLEEGANAINFTPLPQMSAFRAEVFLRQIMYRSELFGAKLKTKIITKDTVGDYPAVMFESEVTHEGKQGYIYQTILVGENSCVLFLGACTQKEVEKYLPLFKKTLASIKINE